MVARLGGDEFAVLQKVKGDPRVCAIALADRILGVVGEPCDLDGHRAIVETSIARLIEKRGAEGRAAGVGPETETRTVLYTLDSARVLDRREPIAAHERVQTKGGLDADAAWAAVEKAQAAVRAAVIGIDGLALGEITYPHRSFGTLDLYQWIVFTATHEMRHILQIREIGAALKTATPS